MQFYPLHNSLLQAVTSEGVRKKDEAAIKSEPGETGAGARGDWARGKGHVLFPSSPIPPALPPQSILFLSTVCLRAWNRLTFEKSQTQDQADRQNGFFDPLSWLEDNLQNQHQSSRTIVFHSWYPHDVRAHIYHKAQRSSIGRFPLCKWCNRPALYSKLPRRSLYVDLHNRYRRSTDIAGAESWSSYVLCYGNYFIVRMSSRACDVMLLHVFMRPSCNAIYRVYIRKQASAPCAFIVCLLFLVNESTNYWHTFKLRMTVSRAFIQKRTGIWTFPLRNDRYWHQTNQKLIWTRNVPLSRFCG